ncbi:MAG: hypothetical protein H0X62_12320 [Bacteroidetes bacterium]|nr:hypothetical protein [Bacteroidota bacterium]
MNAFKRIALSGLCLFTISFQSKSQEKNEGSIHGNFQADMQYYNVDTLIGAPIVPEKMGMNGFANIIYTKGNFSAGIRYESYLNALQGFDAGYQGNGIPFRYASYNLEGLDVTVGSFYEQYGTGLLLRAYEERGLGYDNAFDGIRLKYKPIEGVYLKTMIGKQRIYFDNGPGIVRGIDGEVIVNDVHEIFSKMKTRVSLGGSFVSKFQADRDPIYNLPENVGGYGGRINLMRGKFGLLGEYVYKINDPSIVNNYIYRHGEALFLSGSYSQKGLGITLAAKRIDNMNFRSDRNATINNLNINFLPALTKQHTYNLAATLYPYATQFNGEMGLQGDIVYTFKKGSLLGGKYGTTINVNYSAVNSIDTIRFDDTDTQRIGYSSSFLKPGEEVYFRDFNIEISKKWNKKIKTNLSYIHFIYNMDVVQGLVGNGIIYADIAIADISYRFNDKHTIRTELQSLTTKQDQGNWGTAIIEYTYSPSWFVAIMDQYNYGNEDENLRIHYVTGSIGYTKNTNRFLLSYGRQRAGIFCIGGVCRNMPASNGLMLTITSSF